jgi:stage V sporulation protein G
MSDTVPVTFTVTEIRRLHSAGRLLALATVEINLDGVAMTLHGVAVTRLPNGSLQCAAPRYRTTTGQWAPAVTLPAELEIAIGNEVVAAFHDPQPLTPTAR